MWLRVQQASVLVKLHECFILLRKVLASGHRCKPLDEKTGLLVLMV